MPEKKDLKANKPLANKEAQLQSCNTETNISKHQMISFVTGPRSRGIWGQL